MQTTRSDETHSVFWVYQFMLKKKPSATRCWLRFSIEILTMELKLWNKSDVANFRTSDGTNWETHFKKKRVEFGYISRWMFALLEPRTLRWIICNVIHSWKQPTKTLISSHISMRSPRSKRYAYWIIDRINTFVWKTSFSCCNNQQSACWVEKHTNTHTHTPT